jgi:glycyl-tRNA synthetase
VQQRLSEHDHDLVLRPETTPSTYVYMSHVLAAHAKVRLPLCVWQAGKSFRREQDQATKHVRLKEFWQMEFQCAYAADTANDYHSAILEPVRRMLAAVTRLPTRIAPSDRLPAYSEITMDVEVDNGDKWMEVASISRRTDFPGTVAVTGKSATRQIEVKVLEIAIGLDRCVYNWSIADARDLT